MPSGVVTNPLFVSGGSGGCAMANGTSAKPAATKRICRSFMRSFISRSIRQGLALLLPDTLISRVDGGSGDGDFFVGAKDGAQGVANLAQRGVGFDGLVDERHQVFGSFGGLAKRGEAAGDFVVRAFAA